MADWNKKSKNECWKSSVNRFCKYCKCWVADNKASWAGHEQGSRHKAAVEDKLMEMKRQAVMTQKHGQVGLRSSFLCSVVMFLLSGRATFPTEDGGGCLARL